MADPVAWKLVERGWAVVASDGSEVGKVNEVLGSPEADIFDGFSVGEGAVLDRPRYVPSEQVGAIEVGTVHLTIGTEDFAQLEPYQAPPPGGRFAP